MSQNNPSNTRLALEAAAFLFATSTVGVGGYHRANQDFAQMPPEARVAGAQRFVGNWQNYSFSYKYNPLAVGMYVACKEQLKR